MTFVVHFFAFAFEPDPQTMEVRDMAIEARVQDLDAKHRELDAKIQSEMKRPNFDDLTIADLKRQKLALKDQISALRRGH